MYKKQDINKKYFKVSDPRSKAYVSEAVPGSLLFKKLVLN